MPVAFTSRVLSQKRNLQSMRFFLCLCEYPLLLVPRSKGERIKTSCEGYLKNSFSIRLTSI